MTTNHTPTLLNVSRTRPWVPPTTLSVRQMGTPGFLKKASELPQAIQVKGYSSSSDPDCPSAVQTLRAPGWGSNLTLSLQRANRLCALWGKCGRQCRYQGTPECVCHAGRKVSCQSAGHQPTGKGVGQRVSQPITTVRETRNPGEDMSSSSVGEYGPSWPRAGGRAGCRARVNKGMTSRGHRSHHFRRMSVLLEPRTLLLGIDPEKSSEPQISVYVQGS